MAPSSPFTNAVDTIIKATWVAALSWSHAEKRNLRKDDVIIHLTRNGEGTLTPLLSGYTAHKPTGHETLHALHHHRGTVMATFATLLALCDSIPGCFGSPVTLELRNLATPKATLLLDGVCIGASQSTRSASPRAPSSVAAALAQVREAMEVFPWDGPKRVWDSGTIHPLFAPSPAHARLKLAILQRSTATKPPSLANPPQTPREIHPEDDAPYAALLALAKVTT